MAFHSTMRLAALYSGGKDSTYAMMVMELKGHEIPFLLTVYPTDSHSMMFHTPNIGLAPLAAEAMGKTLLHETASADRELQALRTLLERSKESGCEGVVTGAIQSDYQFTRIDRLCYEAGLKCFSPLWRKDQGLLVRDIARAGIRAMIVATAAEGLGREHLGRSLDAGFIREIEGLSRRLGVNISGEGGEYETLVLDSPLHREALHVMEYSMEATATASHMLVTKVEKGKKFVK